LLTRHALLTYAAKHWPDWQAWLLHGIVQLEARCRRWLAHWRGETQAAELFTELEVLAGELRLGQTKAARSRLRRLVQQEDAPRLPEPVHRHSQSQPARSVAGLSRQRQPACAH